MELLLPQLRKLAFAVAHPTCWPALALGVAPSIEHMDMLRSLEIDGIIDIGANRGQFSMACRIVRPLLPIVAFEPIPAEAATYRRVHGRNPKTVLVELAVGETPGTATLHLSKKADSSSLLPIGHRQTELFRNTAEVGTITVPVQRLDNLTAHWMGRSRQLLKLDVQGFELNVLRGATEVLKTCAYVFAECSEISLYEGQALRTEVAAFLRQHGFGDPAQFSPHYHDGQLIQADYLFSARA